MNVNKIRVIVRIACVSTSGYYSTWKSYSSKNIWKRIRFGFDLRVCTSKCTQSKKKLKPRLSHVNSARK